MAESKGFITIPVAMALAVVASTAVFTGSRLLSSKSNNTTTSYKKVPVCENDLDCDWCGRTCLYKPPLENCPDVLQPGGYSCSCVEKTCKSVEVKTEPTRPVKCEEDADCYWCNDGCVPRGIGIACSSDITADKHVCSCNEGACVTKPMASPTPAPTPTPSPSPTPSPKTCSNKSDCSWCGRNCVLKGTVTRCPLVAIPDNYSCECVDEQCKTLPVPTPDPTPVTTSTSCSTDSDCSWCGRTCTLKSSTIRCIDIAPPYDYACSCIKNVCQATSSAKSDAR